MSQPSRERERGDRRESTSWTKGGALARPAQRGTEGWLAGAAPQEAPAFPCGAARVLVVDDEDSSRCGLARLLALDGYLVTEAPSGLDALARARERRPDLVVTDLNMPGMDGLELTRQLGQLAPRVPVLMVTAAADEALRRQALGAGARGCLAKPLDVERLLDWIGRLLAGG